MRRLSLLFVAVACAAILAAPSVRAQGYQFLQRNCPSCVVAFGTVTASTSVQTPVIKGSGGSDRILLPSGDTTTFKGGTNTANGVAITGTASGSPPTIAATGTDTNISLNVVPKGTGGVQVNGKTAVVYSSTSANPKQMLSANATLASGAATVTFSSISGASAYSAQPQCTCSDATALNVCDVSTSATQLVLHGTGTDVLQWICIGDR